MGFTRRFELLVSQSNTPTTFSIFKEKPLQNHQNENGLGELINDNDVGRQRDAVHIAVSPAVAFSDMKPGQHVGIIEYRPGSYPLVGSSARTLIGICDPLLLHDILKGQNFWLWIYPGSVSSLKHVWTHPEFTRKNREKPEEPAAVH